MTLNAISAAILLSLLLLTMALPHFATPTGGQ
jgi:hypothetical protein